MPEAIKAVLVSLNAPIMPNTKEDKELTEEFMKHKKIGRKGGKWSKNLLPPHAFEKMRKIASDFRNQVHYKLTLTWEDGQQLLPAGVADRYKAAAEEAQAEFFKAKREFADRYHEAYTVPRDSRDAAEYFALLESREMPVPKPRGENIEIPCYVDQAKIMHNGTFNPSLYPSWGKIAKRFDFQVAYSPVPRASHFLSSGFAAEAIEEMRQAQEARTEERVSAAKKETWDRLIGPVQHMAESLTSADTIFRDSLIGNVKDIVALIPALNMTGDSELAAAAKEIEDRFANLDPEVLRNDAAVRKEVGSAAKRLVSTFGKVGKRKFAK
jgi:hypothetical protein